MGIIEEYFNALKEQANYDKERDLTSYPTGKLGFLGNMDISKIKKVANLLVENEVLFSKEVFQFKKLLNLDNTKILESFSKMLIEDFALKGSGYQKETKKNGEKRTKNLINVKSFREIPSPKEAFNFIDKDKYLNDNIKDVNLLIKDPKILKALESSGKWIQGNIEPDEDGVYRTIPEDER